MPLSLSQQNAVTQLSNNLTYQIMSKAKNTIAIKNDFNRLAESLGCRARLAGNAKSPKFQMWTGSITSDGYELVVGIDANTFGQLINKYPELH